MDNLEIIATLHAQVEDKQAKTVHNTTQKTKKDEQHELHHTTGGEPMTNFTIQTAVSPCALSLILQIYG